MNMKKILVENQIEKVKKLDISVLLVEQTKSKEASCLPVSATCNRTLSNILLQQHWHLLKIDQTLEDTFQQTLILAFRWNRNLESIIGSNRIEFNKVKQKSLTLTKGNCTPCLSNNRKLLQTND